MADGDRGTSIEGNAAVDGDFVGRDHQNSGNQVHIAMERLSEVSERETDQIRELSRQIAALTRALIGDPLYGSTGLVQNVEELKRTGQQRERWRIVSTWLLVVTVVAQMAQWWLLYRVYELYWVIFQAVNGG